MKKFGWFDPSPIERFNLDKNRVGHDLLGQRAAEPVENLRHLPVLLVEQAAGLALLRDELHEQRVRHRLDPAAEAPRLRERAVRGTLVERFDIEPYSDFSSK